MHFEMFIVRWRLVCLCLNVLKRATEKYKKMHRYICHCSHVTIITDNTQSTPDADRLGHGWPFMLPTGYATTLANGVLSDVAPQEVEELHHIQQDETSSHWGLNKNGHRFANDVIHDDVIKWKHFPRNWPFVRGIHRSTVNSPRKGQWRKPLMFSLICTCMNGWWFETPSHPLWRHSNEKHFLESKRVFWSKFYPSQSLLVQLIKVSSDSHNGLVNKRQWTNTGTNDRRLSMASAHCE